MYNIGFGVFTVRFFTLRHSDQRVDVDRFSCAPRGRGSVDIIEQWGHRSGYISSEREGKGLRYYWHGIFNRSYSWHIGRRSVRYIP